MKIHYLLLASGLAGCANPSPQEVAESLVREEVQASLPNPVAYKSIGFDVEPYTRQDSAAAAAGRGSTPGRAIGGADTTRIGWEVRHVYWAEDADASLVKQEARFAVYPPKTVVRLVEH
ncbi:hypothetical protein [Hymenobacter arizonensis]|uniref:hypothetical protein n=1 Tax=Hymenobacter arizonensis TaxID=1227077 RepID=UPI000B80F678|nr:hypothetical protein [Hymenobacter arizonensis]